MATPPQTPPVSVASGKTRLSAQTHPAAATPAHGVVSTPAHPVTPTDVSALRLTLRALEPLLANPEVTEVCINRPQEAFVETSSGWHRETLPFATFDWCRRLAKLVANSTGEIVGFGSHRITGPDNALLLISGVKPEYKSLGLGALLDQFAWNELKRKGIKFFYGHTSNSNYPIINLVMRGMGFRLIQSFVVLRKIYGDGDAPTS